MAVQRLQTTNLASTVLASGITNVVTSLTVSSTTGSLFPALTYAGDFFMGALINTSGQVEIVKVTARSTDTLTIVRGQEGTTARAYSANDRFELRLTAAGLQALCGGAWQRDTNTPTYVGSTSFTLPGDQTAVYTANRALYLRQTSSTNCYVVSAVFSTSTTVTVSGGTVDSGIVAVEYGLDPSSAPMYGGYPTQSGKVGQVLQTNGSTPSWTLAPSGNGIASVASASTVDLGAQASANMTISGTTTITSFGTTAVAGQVFTLKFSGACPITYNGTSMILPTGASLTTAAGDIAQFQCISSGNFQCIDYQTASGLPLASSVVNTQSFKQGIINGALQVWQRGISFTGIAGGTTKTIFLTGSGTYTIPGDWNNANNLVACIGGGGGGGGSPGTCSGSGGGGGAYASRTNMTISGGISYTIGAAGTAGSGGVGGGGGDTYFNSGSMPAPGTSTAVGAKGGSGGAYNSSVAAGGSGGAAASCCGAVTNSGGAGGSASTTNGSGGGSGGGGGGAAGPQGNGGAGGNANSGGTGVGGGGGGGSGGGGSGTVGGAGQAGQTSFGGTGGNNAAGFGGGASNTAGTVGGGGGGGYGAGGAVGGPGADWTATVGGTAGPGGGGGGAGQTPAACVGSGGLYGGGGGAGSSQGSGWPGAAGAQGLIVVQYTTNYGATYTADGWFAHALGGAATVSRVAGSNGFKYGLKMLRPNGNSATGVHQIGHVLASIDCSRFQGQSVELSFWAQAGANFSAASSQMFVKLLTGTGTDEGALGMEGGSWTGYAATLSQNQAVTTSVVQYGFTCTIPSGATEIGVIIGWTPVGTAGADDSLTIEGIAIKPASAGLGGVYDFPSYDADLEACRNRCIVAAAYVPATTAQNLRGIRMRAVPSISGGGSGFTSTGTTADVLVGYQTTGAVQTLTISADL